MMIYFTPNSRHRSDEAEEAGSGEEEPSGDEEPLDGEDLGHGVSLLL